MENKNKRCKLLNKDDTSLQIYDLPQEIFQKILGYLTYEELCQVGRVCKSWHAIAKSPTFWKRVHIKFLGRHGSERAVKFAEMLPPCVTHLKINFEMLPPCVTHLKINFDYAPGWNLLHLTEILGKLEKSSPNLQVLIFHRVYLMNMGSFRLVEYLCETFLSNIRILVLHHCTFSHCTFSTIQTIFWGADIIPSFIPKLEILDLSRSSRIPFENFVRIQMPHLKRIHLARTDVGEDTCKSMQLIVPQLEVLDLEGTIIGSGMFETVRNYGRLLTELYMCFTFVSDEDLTFNDTDILPLPRLRIMCLRACDVTHKGIASLLKSCQSLKRVCVGDLKDENKYSKCDLEKVVIVNGLAYCDHYNKLNYMRM